MSELRNEAAAAVSEQELRAFAVRQAANALALECALRDLMSAAMLLLRVPYSVDAQRTVMTTIAKARAALPEQEPTPQ